MRSKRKSRNGSSRCPGNGRESGLKFFRDLFEERLTVRNETRCSTTSSSRAKIPLALTLYSYLPEQSRRSGAPIDWFALRPTSPNRRNRRDEARAASACRGPLLRFVLSDGQTLLAS